MVVRKDQIMDKRAFLKTLAVGSLASPQLLKNIDKLVSQVEHLPAEVVARDEDFWAEIRRGYRLKPDYINLENGYYCITPQETIENFIHHVREVNYQGSWYMRTV